MYICRKRWIAKESQEKISFFFARKPFHWKKKNIFKKLSNLTMLVGQCTALLHSVSFMCAELRTDFIV